MTVDELLALSPEEVVAALAPLTEKQRAALAPGVRTVTSGYAFDAPPHRWLLAAGCLGGARQVARAVELTTLRPGAEALVVEVLRDRSPHWLDALPAAFEQHPQAEGWRLVRALVRAGLVEPPDSAWYAVAAVYSLTGWLTDHPSVLDALRADPGLLDDYVWTMLRTEGAGSHLAGHDSLADGALTKYRGGERDPEHTWRHAFATLAAEGTLDRGRLLDTTLAAFLRDWRPMELPWFAAFHERLAPTVDEIVARQETYARLLAVAYGPAVKLAQQAFGTLLDAGRLDADLLLGATPAVLQRPDKGRVTAQLSLLATLAKRRPDLAGAVAEAARVALEHQRADVRERAAALVAPDEPPGGRVVVAEPAGDAPVTRPAPLPVVPVAGPDELLDVLTRLVEEADDPIEVERAYDGVVRFARHRPGHGGEALAKRAEELVGGPWAGPWGGDIPRGNVASLALVWLRGYRPEPSLRGRMNIFTAAQPDRSLAVLVGRRAYEVARAAHAGGPPLLSLPTASDGTIAPDVLAARLAGVGRLAEPLPVDVAIAALRVPPGAAVGTPAGSRTGRALRAALATVAAYAPEWERVVLSVRVGYDMVPAAAWRDRRPVPDDPVLGIALGRPDPTPDFALDMLDGEYVARFDQAVAQWPLLLPHHPELLAAHAHARLTRGLGKNKSASGPLLDGLARSAVRTGPVVASALALGLAQQDGALRTRAVDAVVDLAGAGLLDGAELGRQVAAHLTDGVVVGTRVAAALAEAARAGQAASRAVLDTLVALLPALPGRRDASGFVDLLAEVAVAHQRRVTLPAELAALARGRSSSALAAACRRVPA